ncbi:MAG: cobalamin-dependent protein [Candidatus Riflebacteria bacterium]|nr:cobalamin-dependent protein [Candidatus Riflebacteria bacterium]
MTNNSFNEMKENLKSVLLEFDKVAAEEFLNVCSQNGKNIEILTELITVVLNELGEEWSCGDLALSQIYMSSRICEEIVDKLVPHNQETQKNDISAAIVSLMDYHVLGKRIVYSFLRASGFELLDLGGVSNTEILVKKVIKKNIKILLISTLMHHSALSVQDIRKAFDKRNYQVKLLVGGAPFLLDDQLWKKVGADAMGKSPADAVRILNSWLEAEKP